MANLTGEKQLGPRKILLFLVMCAGAAFGGCGGDDAGPEDASLTHSTGTLPSVLAMNALYSYEDLDAAWVFYDRILGFGTVADYGSAKVLRVGPDSYLTLVDQGLGVHPSDAPKTVTLAVVTDEVEGWWDYLTRQGVEMRAPLGVVQEGSPHDGFVAIDPEGYFLEFERFNPHPENEVLLPMMDRVPALYPGASGMDAGGGSTRPPELGVRGTVLWLYYEDLEGARVFYEDLLGVETVVDQGWAKVLPGSRTGFLGLVDGARGLHRATEGKAVTVSFLTTGLEPWLERAEGAKGLVPRAPEPIADGDVSRALAGYDPEGYLLEWNELLDVEVNRELLKDLEGSGGLAAGGSHGPQ